MNVSNEVRETYISWSAGLLERDERNIRAGEWDHATKMQVLAKFEAEITQRVRDEALEEVARLIEAGVPAPYITLRRKDNLYGLEYAAAIRQMIGGGA